MSNLKGVLIGARVDGIFGNHLRGIRESEGSELYGICDNHEDLLKRKMEEFNIERGVLDYREYVNDPNVDYAVIAAPDYYHKEMTTAFLKAGKHVLLEKPMALTLEECKEMIKTEKETGCRLMVGQVCRFNNNFVQAKKIIDEGHLGELVFVEGEYAHDYKERRGVDDWRVNPLREAMIGGGCHSVDLLRWIAGDPLEVHAFSNHKYLLDWPVNDSMVAIFKFPNDVIGKVFCSIGVKRNYTMRHAIYGTKGTLIFDNGTKEMYLFECDADGNGYTKKQIIPCNPQTHNMMAEVAEFVAALRENRPFMTPSYEGAYTVAACRAAVVSARTGETVKIQYPVECK